MDKSCNFGGCNIFSSVEDSIFKNLIFKFSSNLTLPGLVPHLLTIRDQCSHDLSPDGLENPVQITHTVLS